MSVGALWWGRGRGVLANKYLLVSVPLKFNLTKQTGSYTIKSCLLNSEGVVIFCRFECCFWMWYQEVHVGGGQETIIFLLVGTCMVVQEVPRSAHKQIIVGVHVCAGIWPYRLPGICIRGWNSCHVRTCTCIICGSCTRCTATPDLSWCL